MPGGNMRQATIQDMELGNFVFGNSRGEYLVEPREVYQDMFYDFLVAIGCDGCAVCDNGDDFVETEAFIVRPYYWGDDESIAALPNFVYKPTGLEISWYKYPMRDAYSNMDISLEEFYNVLTSCKYSISGGCV